MTHRGPTQPLMFCDSYGYRNLTCDCNCNMTALPNIIHCQVRANTKQTWVHTYFFNKNICKTREDILQIHVWIPPSFLLLLCMRCQQMLFSGFPSPFLHSWQMEGYSLFSAAATRLRYLVYQLLCSTHCMKWTIRSGHVSSWQAFTSKKKTKQQTLCFGNPEDWGQIQQRHWRAIGYHFSVSSSIWPLALESHPKIHWRQMRFVGDPWKSNFFKNKE